MGAVSPAVGVSALASSACRGDLHVLQWQRRICNNAVKFALLVRLFGSTPYSCRGWPSLQVGLCEVLIWLLEAFQRRIPASAKSQRGRFVAEEKKSEMRWQAASYSQMPLPFWRATPPPWIWLVSFTLHEPIRCSYNCVIEKGFSEGEKRDFPILTVRVKYRKGTLYTVHLHM